MYDEGQAKEQEVFQHSVIDVYLRWEPMDMEIVRALYYELPLVTCSLIISRTAGNGKILVTSVSLSLSL